MKLQKILILFGLTFTLSTSLFAQDGKNLDQIRAEIKQRTEALNKKITDLAADSQSGAISQEEYENQKATIEAEKQQISDLRKIVNAEGEAKRKYNSGLGLLKQKRYTEAIAELEEATKILPDFDKAYYLAGQCYSILGDNDGALTNYQSTIEHTESASIKAKAYNAIGNVYKKQESYAKAIENYDLSIAAKANDNAYIGKGEVYMSRGGDSNVQKAISSFEAALKVDSKSSTAAYNLGVANEIVKQFSKAIEAYKIAAKSRKYKGDANVGLAKAYNALGQYQNALNSGNQALKSKAKRKAECYCELGEANRKLGKKAQAIENFNACAEDGIWKSVAEWGIKVTNDPSLEQN